MNFTLILSLLFLSGILSAWEFKDPQPKRTIELSTAKMPANVMEVVLPENYPVAQLAAGELQKYLSEATRQNIPLVKTPTGRALSLIVGDNTLLRQAGMNPDSLPDQGFFIRRIGNQIFIAGLDSKTDNPANNKWRMWFDRGTISGVYDFLERFAGCRFYFPGRLGTIVPKNTDFALPEKINIIDRPDFISRKTSKYLGKSWYDTQKEYNGITGENLQILRNRLETYEIPCNHGLAQWQYGSRFEKTHPEYFALMPDGRRYHSPTLPMTTHLCFSSGVKEQIYQDAKGYLTGRPSSEYGLKHWNINGAYGRSIYNIMPQDWFYVCCCPGCQKLFGSKERQYITHPEHFQKISNGLWKFTADIANRLKTEGVKGYITQMSYLPYHRVPQVDLPDNLLVMAAVAGPWKNGRQAAALQKEDDQRLADWNKKLKKRVWIWTYSYKYSSKYHYEALPEICPRAIGHYYQDRTQWIFGAYHAGPSEDSFLYTYLNWYIISKVCWDNSIDVEKTLEEHHRMMFGAKAAVPMKKFYDLLEDLWVNGVVCRTVETALGPEVIRPSLKEIWEKIYTAQKLSQLSDQMKQAVELSSGIEKERVLLMKKDLLDPLIHARQNFYSQESAYQNRYAELPARIVLKNCKVPRTVLHTEVEVSQDDKNLKIVFTCPEPDMKNLKSQPQPRDGKIWGDSAVEVILAADDARSRYYHFMANPSGSLYDSECTIRIGKVFTNKAWNGKIRVIPELGPDFWKLTMIIPKDELGLAGKAQIPANFCRTRVLKTMKAGNEEFFMWTPLAQGADYHNVERFGILLASGKAPEGNLLKNGSFTQINQWLSHLPTNWGCWLEKGAGSGQKISLDKEIFVSGGSSLHLQNIDGSRISSGQTVQGKADTAYRLSFFMRTQGVNTTKRPNGGAGVYIHAGSNQYSVVKPLLNGDNEWRFYEYTFRTSADNGKIIIGLWNWFADGEVWFDDVQLREVK